MTFQEIILALQRYWAERGCVIVQPWDVEKGAGTFNAATYLRSLGPEPWSVAYVEPSRRPTDGRYGENPNRLERHHQFQVLLKPSPKDIQEIYLGSLRAIGIDPLVHDIRFVEDNWESPTLGAWGLGWEVWFDGMEITQFTYFQQCGGYDLDPIAVELTYGLERIAMSLQNVENVYDLKWNDQLTYGEIRHADEVQWSQHNFEDADVQLHLRWFNELKDECLRLCDLGRVIPAYDYCLKCSHVFNILDARGAIGVTERQAYILRVRELAKRCADAYLEHRKELGFPLTAHASAAAPANPTDSLPALDERDGSGPFLLEVGTEEIPARLAPAAAQRLGDAIAKQLDEWGVAHEGLHVDCTPRRLVVAYDAVALRQEDRTEIAKGPPKRIAYDADGNPTRAGQAFLSKVEEGDELFTEDTPKGEYLMVRRRVQGQRVEALLAEALPDILNKLHWPKPMRWGYEKTPFVRPVHWIVAALGGRCVDFTFAGVRSGLQSRGHRFHAKDPFRATTFQELSDGLAERKVILSSDERRRLIEKGVHEKAAEVGGTPRVDPALLEEVTHITEWPTAMLGHFEPELLDLPEQAVVTPMRVHQRYFPIEKDGALLPNFVVIGGTQVADGAVVAHGNARVLRARLADARFFYESDLKRPLEAYLPKLETRIWLAKLGSVWEKVQRLVSLVEAVGGDEQARRAALLCKADLATDMVGEFPELQGEMGRVYARRHGEPEQVAQALFESYLPRNAGDALPETLAGTLVALADRFDSIVGCFGIGLKPTGSKDPYALRRQAIAIINILTATTHTAVPRSLSAWIDASIQVYGDAIHADVRADIVEFFAERTRHLHRESLPADVVDAVVAAGADRPADVDDKIRALVALREAGDLEPVLTTFKRVGNITKDVPAGATYDPDSLTEEPARNLDRQFRALKDARGEATGPGQAAAQLGELRPHVDRFFDDVLVMADDPAVRSARLGLLASIRDTFSTFADFARIQDRK